MCSKNNSARRSVPALIAALFALLMICSFSAQAQTSVFTYQGRFTDTTAAQPTNGTYDFQFVLYDAGGTLIAANSTTTTGVTVINGVFTVQLDFGAAAFPGADRVLEIRLKKPAESSYTTLTPRQPITSTPYAMRALNVAATSGDNLVTALNDAATTTTINDSVLPPNLVRLKPAGVQVSTTTNGSDALLNLRGTYTNVTSYTSNFKFQHDGGFVMTGSVRDVGTGTGCASSIPATGAGTRLMWFPCRGSLRFGRVPTGQANWDDANMNDFTFAGGNQVTASGYGAFAFGEQVTVSGLVSTGFGLRLTVSGTGGFSAGVDNVCSGFGCTATGYTVRAGGQGSVALGYRTTANNDYSVAIGYRASNNTHTGTFVWGDESTTADVNNQFDNEFRIRAAGGIRLRTSAAANAAAGVNGNTGCDLAAGSGAFACSSSRTIKSNFMSVKGEEVLSKIRYMPMTTWNYTLEESKARHIGPVAEDFYSAFEFGTSDKSIAIQDLAGVALVGVKALDERTENLQKENDALKQQMQAQQAQIDALKKLVCAGNPTADICK